MSKPGKRISAFSYEMDSLEQKRLVLKSPNSSFIGRAEYELLMKEYEKLLKMSKKISVISDAQGLMLKQRESDIQNLLDNANQGFLTFGPNLRVNRQFSKQCTHVFGPFSAGADIIGLLCGANASMEAKEVMRSQFQDVFVKAQDHSDHLEMLATLPTVANLQDKSIVLEYKWISQVESDSQRMLMIIATDVTEQLASEEQIRYLSSRDMLTSLYNRNHIEPILNQTAQEELLPFSLLFIDLNGLKLANDVFGHHAGDNLLVKTAQMLQATTGKTATLARWGGDEFIVLLPRTDAVACADLITQLNAACEQSALEPVKLSIAVGAATITRVEEPMMHAFIVAEKQMYKHKLLQSKDVHTQLLNNVAEALLVKGLEREDHLQRLYVLAQDFAEQLGVSQDDMVLLHKLVQFHDAGKLALPAEVLLKPGPLHQDEWELVKNHSEIGYRMASSVGEWALAKGILSMHERWDGGGYPYGLAQEEIPFLSRLLAIAETFDVMTHDQVYKPAESVEQALQTISEEAGRQFDPALASAWVNWMRSREPKE